MSPRGGDRGGRRPLKTDGDPRKRVTFWLRESLHTALKDASAQSGRSIGDIVNEAIEEWIKENSNDKPTD